MKKIREQIPNIIFSILCITLLITSILVGSPMKSNIESVNIVFAILTLFYLLFNHIVHKRSVITNGLDIAVIAFMMSSTIPLIFGTYASKEQTILNVGQYISITAIYFLIKNIMIYSKEKNRKIIILNSVLIICGLIIFILGIDNLTSDVFGSFLGKLDVLKFINIENRFISNLGYANSAGILMAVSSFLAFLSYLYLKNKYFKLIMGSTAFLFLSGLLLSESKGSMIIFAIIYIIFLMFLKDKKEKIKLLQISIIAVFMAFIFTIIFNKFQSNVESIYIWICLIVLYILTMVMIYFTKKIVSKITMKQILITFCVVILLAIIFFIIALNMTKPLIMFSDNNSSEVRRVVNGIEGNSIYKFEFDLSSKSNISKDDTYEIRVEEENKYYQKIESHSIYLNNFSGEKQVNFLTNSDTKRIVIKFIRRYIDKEQEQELKIEKLTINEKEIPLEYKFIPISIVNIMQTLTIGNNNIWERGVFILDGFKAASENLFTGIGGNGWDFIYQKYQSYSYSTSQSHCYITQILIENGIFGLISFVFILILTIKIIIKNKENKICICVGMVLAIILVHSLMDFNMSFSYIKAIVFLLLGIISSYSKNMDIRNITKDILTFGISIIFVIAVIENSKIVFVNDMLKSDIDKKELDNLSVILPYSIEIKERQIVHMQNEENSNNLEKEIEICKEILKIEPRYDKINWYVNVSEIAIEQIKSDRKEKGKENLILAYKTLSNVEYIEPLNRSTYRKSCNAILSVCNKLELYSEKDEEIQKLLKDNYNMVIDIVDNFNKNISNYEITRKPKYEYEIMKIELEKYKKIAEENLI